MPDMLVCLPELVNHQHIHVKSILYLENIKSNYLKLVYKTLYYIVDAGIDSELICSRL